jgi:hypothetical protein
MKDTYYILITKPEERELLGSGCKGKDNIKMDLKKDLKVWTGCNWLSKVL